MPIFRTASRKSSCRTGGAGILKEIMSNTRPASVWEQRWHPLREEWVLFTSHRGGRPWLGETHRHKEQAIPAYDPTCALCPGNKRLKGQNPPYTGTFVFTNDLPCFSAE